MGGTWDRIVAGEIQPGKDGMAIYLDLSTPWLAKVKGVEVFGENDTDGPVMVETFKDPITITLDKPGNEKTTISTTISGDYGGFQDEMDVNYEIWVETYNGSVTVPYGKLDGCVIIKAKLTGELIGSGELLVEVAAHPKQRIVKWTDASGFIWAELKEGWK